VYPINGPQEETTPEKSEVGNLNGTLILFKNYVVWLGSCQVGVFQEKIHITILAMPGPWLNPFLYKPTL
jgi:hypothetical protein